MNDNIRTVCRCIMSLLLVAMLWSCDKYEPLGFVDPLKLEASNIDLTTSDKDSIYIDARIPASGITTDLTFPELQTELPRIHSVRVNKENCEATDWNEMYWPTRYDEEWGSVAYDTSSEQPSIKVIITGNKSRFKRTIYIDLGWGPQLVCLTLTQEPQE